MLTVSWLQQHLPLAVLKLRYAIGSLLVALVSLQQHLPLAVLKLEALTVKVITFVELQQHLPLAVLKRCAMAD